MRQYKISFAGAGNVASALSLELKCRGQVIEQISSINEKNGRRLATLCNAEWSDKLVFPFTTEIIIVAVPDHSIKEVLEEIICNSTTLVVHTAGSIGLDIFPQNIGNYGILYPLQTFSPGRNPDISAVPFFIEASNDTSGKVLLEVANSLTNRVYRSDTEHRRLLHLAAVFVSNFSNLILAEGKEISEKAGFTFDVLEPLIHETFEKAIEKGPENSQTGPAVRNDINTIEKHLELLSFSSEKRDIYDLLTKAIIEHFNIKKRDD